jgi:hypothetical protein
MTWKAPRNPDADITDRHWGADTSSQDDCDALPVHDAPEIWSNKWRCSGSSIRPSVIYVDVNTIKEILKQPDEPIACGSWNIKLAYRVGRRPGRSIQFDDKIRQRIVAKTGTSNFVLPIPIMNRLPIRIRA